MAIGEKAACVMLAAALCAVAAEFPVRHPHLHGGCDGTLTVDANGVAFTGPKHNWQWRLEDIQELKLAPDSVMVLTYEDSRWQAGRDRRYLFLGQIPVKELHALLWPRMDQRLVAGIAEPVKAPVWSAPVKHLGRIRGSEGTLAFGASAVVYATGTKNDSRTWRYEDIDTISSSGPFQLTITTFERDQTQYGDRRGFNFVLKQPITEAKYNDLWLRVEKEKGRIP
jgi:hypothetical protein